jgi:uncharacterized repeat protein (TIGR01451 family)
MNDGLKGLPRRGIIFVLAAIGAWLGVPALLAASETITCDAKPLIANPVANPLQSFAQLGWTIAVDKNENQIWLAAGANQDNAKAGSVSMYLNPGPGTPQTGSKIIPADLQAGDQFGSSVSLSGDWLAVGAPVGDGKVRDSGVVYLFHRDGSTWAFKDKLDAADATRGAKFGFSVSLSGTTLVVGAPDDSGRGSHAGAAYVFEMQGDVWKQMPKLLANDGRAFDEFGSAVATSGDEIVVGAPFADDLHVFRNFGAAYVFRRNTANTGWSLEVQGKLTAADTIQGNNIQFGWSVAIRGDRIVVGAPGDDRGPTDSGSAYVFERRQGQEAGWLPPHRLGPEDPADPKPSEQFGTAVLIDAKDRVVIGAPFDGSNAGAAYLFEKQNGNWIQSFKFLHVPGGAFGQSVAILDNKVFMGGHQYDVPLEVGTALDAGAVATCSIPIPHQPNPLLTCTKTGPESVDAGGLAMYKITVTNEGDAAAANVMLSDATPAGLTFVRADKPCDKKFPCSLGMIPSGTSVSKTVTFRVPEDCSAPSSIQNTATVKGDGVDLITCPAHRTTVVRSPREPILECEKLGPTSVRAGDVIDYKLTVSNLGCAAANNVSLSDVTPPGLTYMSGPCVQSACNLGTIGPGQSPPPVMVRFKVPSGCAAPTSITNTATTAGSNAVPQTCSVTTAVRLEADLGISVSAPAQVAGGDSFKISVVVTNGGPHTAQGATADVAIGASAIITGVPLSCNPVPNQPNHFTCTLNDLPCGGFRTLDFMVRAPACVGCAAGNPIGVTAEAQSQTPDPTLPNRATATVQVTCPPATALKITKTDAPDPVVPGQGLIYDIKVENTGALAVSGSVVEDDFPAELTKVRWCRGTGCTPNRLPPLKETMDLAAGETRIYRLSGIVRPMCSGVLHNEATITPPAGVCDDPSDNQHVEDTQVVANGVLAFCEGISGSLMESTVITKTFLLINCGPANQTDNPGDEFTDVLPAALTLISVSATSGTAATSANTARWNGAIPAGGTVTITINANINAGTAGTILCNQATIAFDADGNGTNESTGFSDDPDQPGPADPCCFQVLPFSPGIPTLSGSGLAALALLLAGLALLRLRRRSIGSARR